MAPETSCALADIVQDLGKAAEPFDGACQSRVKAAARLPPLTSST
jgi:hypothetical protein